jgi:hypothetical protein
MSKTHFSNQNCPGQEETIHLYLDGELGLPERETFEIHLEQCQTCQVRLAELEALIAELVTLEELAAPNEIVDQVMAKLPATTPAQQQDALSWLVLASQVALGLGLIVFILPFITPVFNNQLLRLPWVIFSEMFHSLSNWLTLSTLEFSNRLQAWPETMAFTWLDLSPLVASAVVVGLGLAWLIGNTMLLSPRHTTSKNGGV